MRRIGILTSGGDAPGMNAAIRAVTRSGIDKGFEIFGVRDGFQGLIKGDFLPLGARSVGGIINTGGTMLGSARCPEFRDEVVQREALKLLEKKGIYALVVIGGDGSQTGATALSKLGFPVVGIASTIDNDLYGSEITIGVDTALNIALESVDRLRVTASSLKRVFFVEVMGRNCGYLALCCAIVGGAEAVLIPEVERSPEQVLAELEAARERGKRHAIVVAAEGSKHNAASLMSYFRKNREKIGYEPRATILGHVQRGGSPSAFDRMLATRLGVAATEKLAAGEDGVLVGWLDGQIANTPLLDVVSRAKIFDTKLLEMARVLST